MVAFGLGVVVLVAASLPFRSQTTSVRATGDDRYFRVMNGAYALTCADWRYDDDPFRDIDDDGDLDPFQRWWSGEPRFWNSTAVHGCWHNDELLPVSGKVNRPGIDYTASEGTAIYFRAINFNDYTAWHPAVLFHGTGCLGVGVDVYTPSGIYRTTVNYWYSTPASGVIGTNWTNHFDVPGYHESLRKVADTAKVDTGCGSPPPHLHQSAGLASETTANDSGNVIGETLFWIHF